MKKIFLILLFLGMIQIISSQQIYQTETNVDLKVPCLNNNSYCSSSSECNLTMIKFDGEVIVNNNLMSYNSAYHNYTLNTSDTKYPGEYRINIVCSDTGIKGSSTFEIILTPTGKSITTSSAITQGIILLLMFGVVIFFLLFAGLSNTPGVKLFFNIIGYITMVLAIGTAYIIMQNSEVQSNLSSTIGYLLFVVGIVFVIIMFYIMINQTRYVLQMMQIKKGFGSQYDDNIF